ncbi:MAG: hypothetical protein HY681_10290 [Chloroflexi bacterium]|nr:hypothetical protein [Chloroflexota bacterium]
MVRRHVKDVSNPRSRISVVSFVVEYDGDERLPVMLRMELPWSGNYQASLSWDEWESIVAWFHGEHALALQKKSEAA